MPTVVCPECEEDVFVAKDSEQGEMVSCDECGVDLEIVGMGPFELDPYFAKGAEDYDDGFNIFDEDDDDDNDDDD